MANIFKKDKKTPEAIIEPTWAELSSVAMDMSMFAWELAKIKMKLFNIHVESGRRMVRQVEAHLDGDPEKLRKIQEKIFSEKELRQATNDLDDVRDELEKAMANNLRLYQKANFILGKANEELIDIASLQLSDEEIAEIPSGATPEDIYEKLDDRRDYLDKFIDRVTDITNSAAMKLPHLLLRGI